MKNIFIAALFFLVANVAMAQDAAVKADVKKLIQLAGANAQMDLAKKQVLTMIPAAKQEAFLKEFNAILQPMVMAVSTAKPMPINIQTFAGAFRLFFKIIYKY